VLVLGETLPPGGSTKSTDLIDSVETGEIDAGVVFDLRPPGMRPSER